MLIRPAPSSPRPAGTLGTLAGGAALDALGASMHSALLLCALGTAAGAVLAVLAFAAAGSFAAFAVLFSMAQLAMFASQVRNS